MVRKTSMRSKNKRVKRNTKSRRIKRKIKGRRIKRKTKSRRIKRKSRKNIKLVGGGGILEITENSNETEFEQSHAVINYGLGPISTYNLVNCIAIGGMFELDGKPGTFLTHESPLDYLEQQTKLYQIKTRLDTHKAIITQIILFRIDVPALDVYGSGLTTQKIIELMIDYSGSLFSLPPIIHTYSCDISTLRCGKAIISPTEYKSEITPIRITPLNTTDLSIPPTPRPSETFIAIVLNNANGKKIYQCPICKSITGTAAPLNPEDITLFTHKYDCPNKFKIPKEN